ncbi:SAM-dependent methyltransferase [Acinetobacter nectaris]|uniref:SAM-dependent methyltransferase n=1 Tax=Acinetobacter nectaris TaxID=1219382 RepID=UPI001F26131F|nr:class I SAM-dependent methyltransferase [Acinetobacter nectaris]MCF9033426.1 methyltransferase domain-containing protein [Acinetobacter nectaris]
MTKHIISHLDENTPYINEERIATLKARIEKDFDRETASNLIQQLNDLNEFELGQFLIQHEGLNGHWTHEVVTWDVNHPTRDLKNTLEKCLFEKLPATLATRQRFHIFQQALEPLLEENTVFASIPSGYMSELLLLNREKLKDTQLIGIDLDNNALKGALTLAEEKGIADNLQLIHEDAWNIQLQEELDVITSNGLNIYEHDNDRVIQLYQKFYNALKTGGTLITSFLTPPPTLSPTSPWKMEKIDLASLQLQKVIFIDILQAKWSAYRSVELTTKQLEAVGFKEIELIYDDAYLFPTVIAKK